ncbi:YcdB/YcdC domain-containing protein [Brevibacillus sp. NRS-1366]|uniref:YcdB/YcdC domain-containing protein n=1 Tax=Brevibacillus sp. NRS-1366 TaxID=3233899 RepID=UPI003D1ECF02
MVDPKNEYDSAAYIAFDLKTGQLIAYEASLGNWEVGKKATDEYILQRAEQAVQEVFGTEKRKMTGEPQLAPLTESQESELPDDPYSVYRSVYYPGLLNGLEVRGSDHGILVNMDLAGHLIGITYRQLELDGAKVPDPKTALTPEAAKKKYFTPERLDLGYVQGGADSKPGIQYVLRNSPMLDATTGKEIDPWRATEVEESKRDLAKIKNITIKPKAKSLIAKSEEEARKIASGMFGVDTEKDYTYHSEQADGNYVTHTWTNDYSDYVSLAIDTTTNQVIDGELWEEWSEDEANLTTEEALKKAIAFIEPYALSSSAALQVETFEPRKLAPLADWMKELDKSLGYGEEKPSQVYAFNFNELHGDMPVLDRYYWVVVDGKSGKVVQFSTTLPMKEAAFPEAKLAVTEEQAAELFAEKLPLRLSYIWPAYYGAKAPSLVLVYTIDGSEGWPYVDAVNRTFNWDK